MKKFFLALLLLLPIIFLSGCGGQNAKEKQTDNKVFLTLTDDAGRKVVLKNKPERVVCLSPSFLGMIDAVGGNIVGRASSRVGTIPDGMKNIPEVGFAYNVDAEKIIALKPDCILALKGQHDKFIPLFESNNIPVVEIEAKTYQEVLEKSKLIGQIYGLPQKGEQTAKKLENQIRKITEKIPTEGNRIVILHATAKNVTVELGGTIAGSVADLLKLKNVASGSTPLKGNPNKTPYSLEELVSRDPEIIFITSMGESEAIENRLNADIKSNPAWNSLKAVRNGKVFFLPEQLFLVNPGLRYPEAVKYMAKIVYPEVFTDAK